MLSDLAGLADLHMHSTASDGMLEPAQLLERGALAGLRAMSITDHDTVAVHLRGDLPATGMEIVPGIELSCDTEWGELHLLGYHLDIHRGPFLERLEALRQNRLKRLDRMIDRLSAVGVKLDAAFVDDLRGRPGSIGRPHVARELIRSGAVANFREAFERYLGRDGSAYIPHHNGLSPTDAVRLVADAGGVSSAAHPAKLIEEAPETFFDELRRAGMAGLETQHPSHSANQVKNCRRLAVKLGLVETGGSDFHADADVDPGGRHSGVGCMTVGYAVVARLRDLAGGGVACGRRAS
ncbi:MAG: PHP domain-containing protein [Candidatus Wallbacteria bacterium]|nr:PHP domain-containing protein [Candidatus Wallbacteria bacterium]